MGGQHGRGIRFVKRLTDLMHGGGSEENSGPQNRFPRGFRELRKVPCHPGTCLSLIPSQHGRGKYLGLHPVGTHHL